MSLSFVVVCEAPADRETGCGLADRVIRAEIEWVEQELLDTQRTWRGLSRGEPCLLWREVRERLDRLTVSRALLHGHFGGRPGEPDALAARRALLLIKHASDCAPDAVVLLRDDDRESARRLGLEQAREHVTIGVPIVIGLAHTKRECWVLAGFVPKDEEESQRHRRIQRELGFDPCCRASELTAKHDEDKRSAKRVLAELMAGDRGREAECWSGADLELLRERGQETGLSEYLKEVRTILVPLVEGRRAI